MYIWLGSKHLVSVVFNLNKINNNSSNHKSRSKKVGCKTSGSLNSFQYTKKILTYVESNIFRFLFIKELAEGICCVIESNIIPKIQNHGMRSNLIHKIYSPSCTEQDIHSYNFRRWSLVKHSLWCSNVVM